MKKIKQKPLFGLKNSEIRQLDHSWYSYLLPYATTRLNRSAELIEGKSFNNVLDLGCGTGEMYKLIGHCFKTYTGVDISRKHLDNLASDLEEPKNIHLVQHDLNRTLPFPDDCFDMVISLSVIEYIQSPELFLSEINRVLKPGGIFLFHTMNLAFFPRRFQLLVGKLPTFNSSPGWQGGVLHEFTYPTVKKLLKTYGFQIIHSRCAGILPSIRMWWPNFLASDMIFWCHKEKQLSPRVNG